MPNYKYFNNSQMEFIVVNFKEQLVPGTFEYAINDIIDNHINLSVLDDKYNNDTVGAKAYPPSILLKIILYAYSLGIIHSRNIEYSCKNNIIFMSLAGGAKPDHSTIANFVSSLEDEIIIIFSSILLLCSQLDLIGGEIFALDGCKLSSNASKESSGTLKELESKTEKLEKSIKILIEKHKESDFNDKENLSKRITKYNSKIERIKKFIENNEEKKGTRYRVKKSNITDNESAKMISSHGFIQGYNGLSLVDSKHQVVVYPEAYGTGQEGEVLQDTLESAKELIKQIGISEDLLKGKKVICDTNYFSEANCKYLSDKDIEGYIPDQYFRKRDSRFPERNENRKRKNLYSHDDFVYNEYKGHFVCPKGKLLTGSHTIIKYHGYRGMRFYAKKKDCQSCQDRFKCLKKNAERRSLFITIDSPDKTHSVKMMEKIDSVSGRNVYSMRMGIVEPVFANITYHKGMNYFTMRGKKKVNIQWVMFMMIHNMEKIWNYGGKYKKRV
jgi:transposase